MPETTPGQMELFDFVDNDFPIGNRELMKVVDQINRKFPKLISVAATEFGGPNMDTWQPSSNWASQRYTADWGELVKC